MFSTLLKADALHHQRNSLYTLQAIQMDGQILNTRLPRDSSGRSRKLESEIASKHHLLVRLVAAINQHSGQENQYYARLLQPHMDFMIHEFR